MTLPHLLATTITACRRHAIAVVLAGLALFGLSLWLGSAQLGMSTDTDELFAASLPWRQRATAFDQAFPQFRDLLVVVIDADIPEVAEDTAAALATRLYITTPATAYGTGSWRTDSSLGGLGGRAGGF